MRVSKNLFTKLFKAANLTPIDDSWEYDKNNEQGDIETKYMMDCEEGITIYAERYDSFEPDFDIYFKTNKIINKVNKLQVELKKVVTSKSTVNIRLAYDEKLKSKLVSALIETMIDDDQILEIRNFFIKKKLIKGETIETNYDKILKSISELKVVNLGEIFFVMRQSFINEIASDIKVALPTETKCYNSVAGFDTKVVDDKVFDKVVNDTTNYVVINNKEDFEKILIQISLYESLYINKDV